MQTDVALLFTDIEGSTALVQELGPSYVGVVAAHRDVVRGALREHGGREVDTQGDAFFAVFNANADAVFNADAAIRCALAIQRRHAGDVGGARVKVRMGLHVGAPLQHDNGFVGVDVHVAARICSAAHGGQVLVSDAARHALDEKALQHAEHATFRDMGDRRLKDLRRLQRVHQLVVDDLPSTFPPLRTLDVRSSNLPAQPDELFGRTADIARIVALLRGDARLVTLTGPGGVGKTRVAIAAASNVVDEFADGVLFVPLAAVKDDALILTEVARLIGLDTAGDTDVTAAVNGYYGGKRALVVLDNLEQIVEGAAGVVARLLDACPKLRIIATSREALRVRAENVVDVAQLPHADAVALFRARAKQARRGNDIVDDATTNDAVGDLCARLDHLPLALELAAARARLLSPSAILERLDAGGALSALSGGPRDMPDRHRALRATIEWSHALLNDDERSLFAALGAFAGSFTKDAAAAVANRIDAFDGIASLVDKSLVRTIDDGERFAMLETVRELAAEKLSSSSQAHEIRRRHAEWFATVAERAARRSPHYDVNIDADVDDIRSAIAWSLAGKETVLALRLAGAPELMWCSRARAEEGIAAVRAALALPFDVDNADERAWFFRGRAESTAGTLAYQRGRVDDARAFHAGARVSSERAGAAGKWEAAFSALCVATCGSAEEMPREFAAAAERFREFVAEGVVGADAGFGIAQNCAGFHKCFTGDPAGAAAVLDETLRVWTSKDAFSIRERVNVIHSHSEALRRCRRFGDARRCIEGSLRESLKLVGIDRIIALSLETLAAIEIESGDALRGARMLGVCAAFRATSGVAMEPAYEGADVNVYEGAARNAIGDDAFSAAFNAGKLLPPEAVLSSDERSDERSD